MTSLPSGPDRVPWYRGVTLSQWLVLMLASAGWVFDVYEGQIFNLTGEQLVQSLLEPSSKEIRISRGDIRFYIDVFLGIFLVGGAVGGVLFGALADRWGRRPVLVLTILTYSVFSGLTALAQELWQVAVLRFLVAFGVGGEWAVASAMVAEAFRARGRAQAGSIFHATSIIGTWLAALAALAVGAHWRYAYLLGVLPALLIVALRVGLAVPETKAGDNQGGRVRELLADARWRSRAILALCLAAVGLGTFWGVTVAGQTLAQDRLLRDGVSVDEAREYAKLAYGWIQTTGGGLGLLAFGPLAARFGRRRTFIVFQVAAIAVVPLTCYAPTSFGQLVALLPLFGFCTLGLHAGFAVYFPELFPTRLRATGAGFCFNGGRLVAAPVLFFSGWLKSQFGDDPRPSITLLSGLFLLGIVLVWFLPETKDQPLPE